MKVTVYRAPNEWRTDSDAFVPRLTLFLGGTIENGSAEDWQTIFCQDMMARPEKGNLDIYNPRRVSWDKDAQSTTVREQIRWELRFINTCDSVLLNFVPNSLSPITLLELGLVAPSEQKKYVVCPRDFWRYDNVVTTLEMCGNNYTILSNIDEAIEALVSDVYLKSYKW